MNVQLDQALQSFVNDLVSSGQYADEAEVIRAGLLLLKDRRQKSDAKFEELRRKIQVGLDELDRGEFEVLDLEAIRAEARREWEQSRTVESDEC